MRLALRKIFGRDRGTPSLGTGDFLMHESDVVKIQAFVRGCLCRAMVTKMVTEWIDELLARKRKREGVDQDEEEEQEEYEYEEYSVDSMGNPLDAPGGDDDDDGVGVGVGDTDENDYETIVEDEDGIDEDKHEHEDEDEDEDEPGADAPPHDHRAAMQSRRGSSVRDMMSNFQDENAPATKRNWTPKQGKKDKAAFLKGPPAPPPLTETEPAAPNPEAPLKNVQLKRNATKHVVSSEELLREQEIRLNEEIQRLLEDIKRIGERGKPYVNFGDLFDDDQVANYYEALVGTLKAAKKKKLITYDGQILLKGVHDKSEIRIL